MLHSQIRAPEIFQELREVDCDGSGNRESKIEDKMASHT